jgi:hypothetical protein
VRTVLALTGAAWFIGAAILIGDGRLGTVGEPPNEEVLGDPTTIAVYAIGRILFVGLGLLCLALVEWRAVGAQVGELAARPGPADDGSATEPPVPDQRA